MNTSYGEPCSYFIILTISQASTCTCNADYVRCYNYICTCCIEINIFFEWCCSVMILNALSVSSQHFIFLKTVYKQGKRKLSIWLWMIEKESTLGRFQTDIHVFKTSLIFLFVCIFLISELERGELSVRLTCNSVHLVYIVLNLDDIIYLKSKKTDWPLTPDLIKKVNFVLTLKNCKNTKIRFLQFFPIIIFTYF